MRVEFKNVFSVKAKCNTNKNFFLSTMASPKLTVFSADEVNLRYKKTIIVKQLIHNYEMLKIAKTWGEPSLVTLYEKDMLCYMKLLASCKDYEKMALMIVVLSLMISKTMPSKKRVLKKSNGRRIVFEGNITKLSPKSFSMPDYQISMR